ncbi:MAG: hypothetical protein GY703_00075 [Gammaproteobacteria bacterium]|nr:hypothetical protein [Gammaproteobacteria bacterium]
MKQRIIIHAGPGKTGSSAIQYWMKTNRENLSDVGVYYPDHRVNQCGISSGNIESVFTADTSSGWRIDQLKISALLDEFYRGPHHTLLLSSEYFYRQIPLLNQAFPAAEFVVYIRHPLEQRESGYNQGIKRHGTTILFEPSRRPRFADLDFLRHIIEEEEKTRLILRPYGPELFAGGSIIADFLSLLDVGLSVEQPPQINFSYSFEALEFKRHANHFPLGGLSGDLDKLLQDCPLGQRVYSLLEPERFKETTRYLLPQIEEFIRIEKQKQLQPYFDHVANSRQKPWRRQIVCRKDLQMIADYVADRAPDVHKKLQHLAQEYRSLPLPNPEYYDCFGIEPVLYNDSIEAERTTELCRQLFKDSEQHKTRFFRLLLSYLEENNLSDAAEHFSEAAFSMYPENEFVREKVNSYRVQSLRNDSNGRQRSNRLRCFLKAVKELFRR